MTELKKRSVFDQLLSAVMDGIKSILEKENQRREISFKALESSLPSQLKEELIKMCPNIIIIPEKNESAYIKDIDPNEMKFIANMHFPQFTKLANLDLNQEVEQYKIQLSNAYNQIKDYKSKVDELQTQNTQMKQIVPEKQIDPKVLTQLSLYVNRI